MILKIPHSHHYGVGCPPKKSEPGGVEGNQTAELAAKLKVKDKDLGMRVHVV